MNILVESFRAIKLKAPHATRVELARLRVLFDAVDKGASAAISLGAIEGHDVEKAGIAKQQAFGAIETRAGGIAASQTFLMTGLPDDRRSKATLQHMPDEKAIRSAVVWGEAEITNRIRNHGDGYVVLKDGAPIGRAQAHGIGVEGDHLVVEGVGRWPIARIAAVSTEDGLAFMLDDREHIEIQQEK